MFQVTMMTFDGKKYLGEVSRISLPTADGVRTILTNHMDIVIPIEIGTIKLIGENKTESVAVSEGLFNFKDNEAHIFVRTYEFPYEVDKERALKAKERAEERLKQRLTLKEMQETELALKRALARLRL